MTYVCLECGRLRAEIERLKAQCERNTVYVKDCIDEFEKLVSALMSHPTYRRAVRQAQDLENLEQVVETARRTRHPSYVEIAQKSLDKFKADYFCGTDSAKGEVTE